MKKVMHLVIKKLDMLIQDKVRCLVQDEVKQQHIIQAMKRERASSKTTHFNGVRRPPKSPESYRPGISKDNSFEGDVKDYKTIPAACHLL